ncbi:MAG: DegT/DnrJ/EryC1/StrS family aminotransferase, partial [candidate division KSB1 bacterium]|nr:DegT/DnrJ/EryC1/StrS family aminotransferase [candidate division KSB1 bacterium]
MSIWKIPLFDSDIGEAEIEAATRVMRSKWLTMGDVTRQFEERFCEQLGVRNALAVSNGTTALHLANVVLGLGPGDEVIVPSLTFVATVNSILYTGATPVFADVSGPNDLNISPADIEKKITSRTKAIMVVHYAGYPCDMPRIMEIARRHNLYVIEDAAHAPGASIAGQSVGMFGDCGCFSFFSNKNMATGEGGMLVTRRDDLAARIKLLRSHGMTSLTLDRYKGHSFSYDVVALGYNYRVTEICSAIGLVQLEKLTANNQRRAELVAYYRSALAEVSDITVPFEQHVGTSAFHILPILLPPGADRQAFMNFLKEQGIQTSIHYPPVHRFTFHRQFVRSGDELPQTESLALREVTLP